MVNLALILGSRRIKANIILQSNNANIYTSCESLPFFPDLLGKSYDKRNEDIVPTKRSKTDLGIDKWHNTSL